MMRGTTAWDAWHLTVALLAARDVGPAPLQQIATFSLTSSLA